MNQLVRPVTPAIQFSESPWVAFRPDWTKHNRAAPFRRNDAMLEAMPIGLVHFPGGGISDNLADKALSRGIPVQRGVKAKV